MKKIHGNVEDWTDRNYKKSFEALAEEGYSFESIKLEKWFSSNLMFNDAWKLAVLVNKNANKIIKETEKALCFSVITQYGNEYEMWFPKSVVLN